LALLPGTRLGVYEVTAQIGAGGMGEVYKATDTNLKRAVALKVLPEMVAADAERLARFQREAEVLAALNHPNIAAIYGLERSGATTALVMEMVEGEDLSMVIKRGPVALTDALHIAKQIADALEAAHEQGIIHRDLKPANIKVRADGTVKVLDFGLAKALVPEGAGAAGTSASLSPTLTSPAMTQAGMILGTAAYMSPEQARGRAVDRRADIWAFGCVLFEMLTGQRAFEGDDISVTLADVIRGDPEWKNLPPGLSPTLHTYLRRCLAKDPGQRVRDIGDVRLALEGAFDTPVSAALVARPAASRARWLWPAVALIVGGLATALVMRSGAPITAPQQVRRFVHTLPATVSLPEAAGTLIGLSPDGQTLVYRASEKGVFSLFRRGLGELDARAIPGTENAGQSSPFFSADGLWVGFTLDNSVLMKVSLAGGRPVKIGGMTSEVRGASWGRDDSIILGLSAGGLARVSAGGGAVASLTKREDSRLHWYPQMLPGGRAVLFTASDPAPDAADLLVLDLSTNVLTTVVRGAAAGRYVPTGHLVFVRGGDLWAVRFDPVRVQVSGEPVVVEQGIRVEAGGAVQMAVADDGTLAYIPGAVGGGSRSLVWVNRDGREQRLNLEAGLYSAPRISPDGTRAVLAQVSDLWIWDFTRETKTKLTSVETANWYTAWTADSSRIAYSDKATGNVYWKAANNTGSPERLGGNVRQAESAGAEPYFFSPSGKELVFRDRSNAQTGDNIGIVALTDGAAPTWLLNQPFIERNAELSPNGRWMAYQSNESGRHEIYVRPFPKVDADRVSVSNAGGAYPLWSRDGRELFYVEPGSPVPRLMSVAVRADEPAFSIGARTPLLAWPYFSGLGRNYDVSKDGRFLALKAAEADTAAPARIVIVEHWFEELKRLVPVN